jgi:UDP-glucose:glycoprotein glucosyltransferase
LADKELYNRFLEVLKDGGHISTPDALASFKLALSIRSAAPKIEAHYQYYTTGAEPHLGGKEEGRCDPWIYLDGQHFCEPTLSKSSGRDLGTTSVV